MAVWMASRLKKRPSPPSTRVLACEAFEAVEDRLDEVLDVMRLLETGTFLRRPDVPGFWSAKGVVATVVVAS